MEPALCPELRPAQGRKGGLQRAQETTDTEDQGGKWQRAWGKGIGSPLSLSLRSSWPRSPSRGLSQPRPCTVKRRDHRSPIRPNPTAGGSGWRLLLREPPETQHPPPTHVQKGPSLSRGTPSCAPTSQATAAGSRVLMPKPPGHAPWEWESPVRAGMAQSVRKRRPDAGKAPRLDKANSDFFSQRTPGRTPGRPDRAGHPISDPIPKAGMRCHWAPGPPVNAWHPPPLVPLHSQVPTLGSHFRYHCARPLGDPEPTFPELTATLLMLL